jgi:alpha-beta hydrolase superfamily lysophospholipase
MAHSTGALPGALYAKEGCRRAFISRIILNSPFLAFPQGRVFAWIGAGFGKYCPFRDTDNLEFKPLEGFRVFYGWIRAVVAAQDRIRAGLDLQQPVLVMHSDKSANDKKWSDRLHRADLVLKVRDIKELGPRLGKQVVMAPITDGKHDLTLSQQGPLEVCLKTMVEWAGKP